MPAGALNRRFSPHAFQKEGSLTCHLGKSCPPDGGIVLFVAAYSRRCTCPCSQQLLPLIPTGGRCLWLAYFHNKPNKNLQWLERLFETASRRGGEKLWALPCKLSSCCVSLGFGRALCLQALFAALQLFKSCTCWDFHSASFSWHSWLPSWHAHSFKGLDKRFFGFYDMLNIIINPFGMFYSVS